ncbi:hypothetical protein [Ruegeria sp. HKCCD8929]|uniref:hypothetical protein n=1 Tax=Ruegeria sp. HKCCD8929 TaxID=2683006 RepID=UPI001489038B|nr:hypothetical protein [Ruegeria sp. HKCCD8929]
MNLTLSFGASFAAIQAGALVVCIGTMVNDSGLDAILEGVGVWVIGQIAILPLALLLTPIGVLIRAIVGRLFNNPKPVALVTGAAVGSMGLAAFSITQLVGDVSEVLRFAILGGVSGLIGGWVWWRIEGPGLERVAK